MSMACGWERRCGRSWACCRGSEAEGGHRWEGPSERRLGRADARCMQLLRGASRILISGLCDAIGHRILQSRKESLWRQAYIRCVHRQPRGRDLQWTEPELPSRVDFSDPRRARSSEPQKRAGVCAGRAEGARRSAREARAGAPAVRVPVTGQRRAVAPPVCRAEAKFVTYGARR